MYVYQRQFLCKACLNYKLCVDWRHLLNNDFSNFLAVQMYFMFFFSLIRLIHVVTWTYFVLTFILFPFLFLLLPIGRSQVQYAIKDCNWIYIYVKCWWYPWCYQCFTVCMWKRYYLMVTFPSSLFFLTVLSLLISKINYMFKIFFLYSQLWDNINFTRILTI